jgi:hypothetical protein
MVGMFSLPLLVQASVDSGDLFHPGRAFPMLQAQDLLMRPMKVISHIRYLLAEPL